VRWIWCCAVKQGTRERRCCSPTLFGTENQNKEILACVSFCHSELALLGCALFTSECCSFLCGAFAFVRHCSELVYLLGDGPLTNRIPCSDYCSFLSPISNEAAEGDRVKKKIQNVMQTTFLLCDRTRTKL
jgi:hypothetical protein